MRRKSVEGDCKPSHVQPVNGSHVSLYQEWSTFSQSSEHFYGSPIKRCRALSRFALYCIREAVSSQAIFAILYIVAMQVIGYALGVVYLALQRYPAEGILSFERVASNLQGWAAAELYLIATAVAFAFMIVYRRSQIEDAGPYGVFHRGNRRMTTMVAFSCLALTLAAQSLSKLYDFGVYHTVGKTSFSDFTQASIVESSTFISPMMLYSCLWGPIVEEVVFRGAILSSLKRYGKVFAIITSSFIFALLHGNLSQGFFAFLLGLILGFLSCEYSLLWAIILHICSNVIATYLPNLLHLSLYTQGLRGMVLHWAQIMFWVLMVVLGALSLYCSRHTLKRFCRSEPQPPNIYASWVTPWFIMVVSMQLVLIFWRIFS